MLRKRLLTAAVLLPLVVLAIFYLPTVCIGIIFSGILALCAWEWFAMIKAGHWHRRLLYLALLILVAYGLLSVSFSVVLLCQISIVAWLLGAVFLQIYPKGAQVFSYRAVAVGLTVIWLLPSWFALVWIHQHYGPAWVLWLLSLVWGADTGAYFMGKAFGRRKLLEKISPGKTWEGVGGAAIAVLLVSGLFSLLMGNYSIVGIASLCLFSLIILVFSIEGDLIESLFKRVYQVKDSGSCLPGHGGILDRLDSLLSSAPVFVLGLKILENFRIIPFYSW